MTTDRDPFAAAPPELRELLALASDLALQAGRVHAEGRRDVLRIETKSSPTDLVSQIDKEAERLIVDGLRAARPDDAVLGEEGSLPDGTSGVRWVVDPLDGTTNYIYGYPAYAASIAVEVDGETRVGVVLDSSSGRLYRAVAGHGAVCDDRPIHAREQTDLSRALVATGFSYDASQREQQGAVVAAALGRIRDIRRGGTAALDLCHIAAGAGGRLLGAGPLAVGLRRRRADRPRGRRRRRTGAGRPRRRPGRRRPRTRRSCRRSSSCCGRRERWPDRDAARRRRGAKPLRRLPRLRRQPRSASRSSGASMTTAAPLSTSSSRVRKPHGAPTGDHPGRRGRAHVHQRVAEVDDARRRQPEPLGDASATAGSGLSGASGRAP